MMEECRRQRTDLLGYTNHRDMVIGIEPKQHLSQRRDTVVHESLHAMLELAGLAAEMADDLEETIVRRLTPFLLGWVRDNPRLIAYLAAP